MAEICGTAMHVVGVWYVREKKKKSDLTLEDFAAIVKGAFVELQGHVKEKSKEGANKARGATETAKTAAEAAASSIKKQSADIRLAIERPNRVADADQFEPAKEVEALKVKLDDASKRADEGESAAAQAKLLVTDQQEEIDKLRAVVAAQAHELEMLRASVGSGPPQATAATGSPASPRRRRQERAALPPITQAATTNTPLS